MKKDTKTISLEPAKDQEWLRAIYAEAWRQYSHEDNLYQSRNTIYLGIQAALLAILTGVSPALIGLEPITVGLFKVAIGMLFFGIIAITFSILGIFLTQNWESLTHVSRAYIGLRFSTAKIIENQLGLEKIGLAGIEKRWSEWSRENQENILTDPNLWYPSGFEDRAGDQVKIHPRPKIGGFDSHLGVIRIIKFAWYSICTAGVASFVITLVILVRALVS